MPFPVVAAIGAGAALASAGANAAATAGRNRKARQWQLDQWKRETKYNAPKNQRQRIIEAGLNPNMLYGSGGPQNTAQAQNINPETPNLSAVGAFGQNIIQGLLAAKQMKKMDAETNYIDTKTAGASISNAIQTINKEIMELKDPAWQGNYSSAFAKAKFQMLAKQMENLTAITQNQTYLGAWNKSRYNTFAETGIDISKDDLPTRLIYNLAEKFFGEQIKSLKGIMQNQVQKYMPKID